MADEITTFPRLYDEPDAIPFINSIVLNPDDDTNRLVFADWLEENAHRDAEFADHYRARCEFIRIGCNSLGGSLKRISKAEGEWLDANWRRLVPTFSRWLKSQNFLTMHVADYHFPKRSGRRIDIRYSRFSQQQSRWLGAFNAIRGFTNFAVYCQKSTTHYRALLLDDPVADPFRYMNKHIKNRIVHDDALILTRSDMPYYLFRNLEYYCDGSGLILENIPKNSPYSEPQVSVRTESDADVRELAILAFHRAMRKWVKEKNFKVGAIND